LSEELPIRVTFKLPLGSRYVGPPSTGAGVAEIRESGVRLEFAYQTGFDSGNDTGGPWDTGLDVYDIRSVRLKRGLLGYRLVIEAEDPSVTQTIPASHQGTVILQIPRAQAEAAKRAESLLARGLAGKQ